MKVRAGSGWSTSSGGGKMGRLVVLVGIYDVCDVCSVWVMICVLPATSQHD